MLLGRLHLGNLGFLDLLLSKMGDIFDNKILCKKCVVEMNPFKITKNGFILRVIECPICHSKIIHPKDEQEYLNFTKLRKKQFSVKMRFVGNSYAVSIPKEIVTFMKEQERIMDNMVKLCFEGFGILRLEFNCQNGNCEEVNENNIKGNIKEIQ